MSTELSPQYEEYVQGLIAQGLFKTRADVLNAAVGLLRLREQVVREVNIGIDELERGEGKPLDLSQVKQHIAARLADQHEDR